MNDIFFICCAMVFMDIVTGCISALKNHELSSGVMRDGLYNKLGEIALMGLSVVCNFALGLKPFNQIGIPPEALYSVCVYVFTMESISIIENICKINPEIPLSKILMIFNLDKADEMAHDIDKATNE